MTYPMTSVRALIEAAGKATPGPWTLNDNWIDEESERCAYIESKEGSICTVFIHFDGKDICLANSAFIVAARNAIPSISQLLREREQVTEYIKELRSYRAMCDTNGIFVYDRGYCTRMEKVADHLAAIQEGK